MIPKVEFRYSYIYDEVYKNSSEIKKFLKKTNKKYPSREETIGFRNRFEVFWRGEERKILRKILEVTGLNWKEKRIICYVVGVCRPMSDPMTIRVFHDMEYAVDMITHELIHNLQINIEDNKWKKWQRYIDSKYSDVSDTTKAHIFLNAVHKKIYLELFDKERLRRDLYESNKALDYKNSWKIVEKEGYESIIRKFRELTK